MRKKIIVRGPVLSRSGYGEQARFALRSLRKHEERFDIYLLNTEWGKTGWAPQHDEERKYIDYLIKKTFQIYSDLADSSSRNYGETNKNSEKTEMFQMSEGEWEHVKECIVWLKEKNIWKRQNLMK